MKSGLTYKVLIAAGGSGGHLFPAQQLSELLKKEGFEVFFAGYKLQGSPFFQKEKTPFQEIVSAPLGNVFHFLKAVSQGLWQSLRLLWRLKPDVVVGFGSYHSFPVLLASLLLRKKIILFEANCTLGKVNRFFLPFAKTIALQFPIPIQKGVLVPLLPWKPLPTSRLSKEEARKKYGLDGKVCTLLVFGGSQGASFLNEQFPKAAKILWDKGLVFQVLHLTGKEGKAHYVGPGFALSFEAEMEKAYEAADLVVCRSGAGSCAELIRFQKPALLIPYPFAAEDHQRINAEYLVNEIQGCRLLLQKEAAPDRMAQEVERLMDGLARYRAAFENRKREKTVDFVTIVGKKGKKR